MYQFDPECGRIIQADWRPSPNYDERPHGVVVDTLIVHAISLPPNHYGGNHVEAFFTNSLDHAIDPFFGKIRTLRVSAHFYIKRSGRLMQFVATGHRAWHAGRSWFDGKAGVNDFSIGVELEGCDKDRFEVRQYTTLISLTKTLQQAYTGITADRLVGHCDIAPGRKTDPGPYFDWAKYRASVLGETGANPD